MERQTEAKHGASEGSVLELRALVREGCVSVSACVQISRKDEACRKNEVLSKGS